MRANHIMILLKIFSRFISIKHCIMVENIFAVIVYDLLVAQKYQKGMLMIVLKFREKMIKVNKKGETAKSKNYGRKKNDADFESILVPEDNEIKNPNNSYSNKHQYHAPVVIVTN